MAKYAVVRTDNMSGTVEGKNLVSLVYDEDIENGCVLAIGDLVEGERELREGTAPAKDAALRDVALICSPEVVKSMSYNALSDFINLAGDPLRGYRLTPKDAFGITAEGFAEGDSPEVGYFVELNGTTKLHAVEEATGAGEPDGDPTTVTVVGKIIAFEDPYFVVEVA